LVAHEVAIFKMFPNNRQSENNVEFVLITFMAEKIFVDKYSQKSPRAACGLLVACCVGLLSRM
jgi:hypothetical protein